MKPLKEKISITLDADLLKKIKMLAEEAIKQALKDYFDKNNIPYDPEQFKETDHDELHAQVHGE